MKMEPYFEILNGCGVRGYVDEYGNLIEEYFDDITEMPMCPKCKNPLYNEDKCPFCGQEIDYD